MSLRKGKLYLVFEYVERSLLEVIEGNKNGVDVPFDSHKMNEMNANILLCYAFHV